MDPATLKARILELGRSVDAIQTANELHPSVRNGIAAQLEGVAAEVEHDLTPAARSSEDKELRDALARLYRSLAIINSWLEGREQRSRDWIDRAAEFAASDVLRDMVQAEQHRLRDSEAFAGIRALCDQGLVDKARRQLIARRKATTDMVMRKRIDEFLADPRNFISPMRSAPTMMTYNGIGTMLYGERDKKPDGTYVATLCLVIVFVPILPIRSYLVARADQGWRFFGKVPLSPFAFWWRRLLILGPLLFGLGLFGWEALQNSPSRRENAMLAAAAEQFARRNFAGAIDAVGPMARSTDAARSAKREQLWQSAVAAALGDLRTTNDGLVFLTGAGAAAARMHLPLNAAAIAAADQAFARLSLQPDAGKVLPKFLSWMTAASPEFAAKKPELAARACEKSDDAHVLATAADAFADAKRPCPADILARLKNALLTFKAGLWAEDAMSYLRAADPVDARPVLLKRVEAAWKGSSPGTDLLALPHLPEALRLLLSADSEAVLEKRVTLLEKAGQVQGLQDPEKDWHRIAVAVRLTKAYGELNLKDPILWPISKAKPWAIQVAELSPENADARLTALRYLIQDGDFDRAIAMGTPAVSDPKTALLVGIALARSGKPEDGAKLLRPLVERDLSAFATAFKEWYTERETKVANGWRSLEKGMAPTATLTYLSKLPKETAQVEAERWVLRQADSDPYISSLQAKWKKFGDIHNAARELAMIELELGQSLPKGAERQARLEAAEALFLELRKVFSDDPHQELQLGQVYFWLGKDKEGQEIYDKLEAGADALLLHRMGEIYRNLSRMDAARRVLERAYQAATDGNAKSELRATDIALTRAIANRTSEDRLDWLKKADTKSSRVKFEIDQTEAEIDLEAGNYQEAALALRRVAAYYAAQPESAMSLNNGSIVQLSLARATGDPKYLIEGLRLMRLAYESATDQAIVLSNYVSDLERAGYAALAGDVLRMDLLHDLPGPSWLEYIVPYPSSEEWAAKAKAQPELRRSAELGQRSVVLSPDGDTGYDAQARYFYMTRDFPAFRRLREQAESRPRRKSDPAEEARAPGQKHESDKKMVQRSVIKWDILMPSLRKAGHARTLAYALMNSAATRNAAVRYSIEGQTSEAALKDAEEALRQFECFSTRSYAATMRMASALRRYAEKDTEFAKWLKDYELLDESLLLALYVERVPERRAAVVEFDAVRAALKEVAECQTRYPKRSWIRGWALLEMAADPARETARAALKAEPITLEYFRLDWILKPESENATLEAWLAATAYGDKELADRIAARAREDKLVPRFFKP